MTTTPDRLWQATIRRIGPDAPDMFDAGVVILFAEPVPEALAEVSVIHDGTAPPVRELRAGDMIAVGGSTLTIDRVGERATANLTELGHVVVYINPGDQDLLPGAVHASGGAPTPSVGDTITVTGG